MNVSFPSLLLFQILLGGLIAFAQEEAAPPTAPGPAEIQEKIREWVRVQQLTIETENGWKEERQILQDFNGLRQKELEQISQTLAAAGERAEHYDAQLSKLETEGSDLRSARKKLESAIGPLEARIQSLLPTFPPPLRHKISESEDRLQQSDAKRPLQERYRDVLSILTEAANFDRQISLHTESREVDGEERELQVLYLGLARAYYVDRSGNFGGIGVPGPEGWTWTAQPALASSIQHTIAVHQRDANPALVRLPLQLAD